MFDLKNLHRKRFYFLSEIRPKINIKLFITLLCFGFIGSSIYGNFDELANQEITRKELIWLLGSIIFSFLSIIINAYAWKLLIYSIDFNKKNINIIKTFLNTNIYKYLPGGIWHFVARYNILRLELSNKKSVESILLEPLLMLVAGLILIPFGSLNIYILLLCWSSTLVFLPCFREFIIKKIMVLKISILNNTDELNSEKLVQENHCKSQELFYPYKPLVVEIIFILFRFFGFFCCINAFSIGLLISYSELISCFCFAWVVGLIVPAAPGGLGVFEAVILFSLGSMIPEAPLLAALLFYRLVSTISDVFAALIYPSIRLLRF